MATYLNARGEIGFQSIEEAERIARELVKKGWAIQTPDGIFWVNEDKEIREGCDESILSGRTIVLDHHDPFGFGRMLEWIFANAEIDPDGTDVRYGVFDGHFTLGEYQKGEGLVDLRRDEVIAAIGFDPAKLDYTIRGKEVADENEGRHPLTAEEAGYRWLAA